MQEISLDLGHVCYERDRPIQQIYFPVGGVVSWLQDTGSGSSVEVATVGREGFVGVPVLLGGDRTRGTALAQIEGTAVRIPSNEFRALLKKNQMLVRILNRYVRALLVQISQGTACNGMHSLEQRCARWLLMTQDRVGRPSFTLTQKFLAQMLGVRRTGVSEAASSLQDSGIIRYVRGVVRIKDRKRLESRSCQCYRIVREEFSSMLRDIHR